MFKGLIVNVTAEYLTGRNMFPCKNKQPNYASETFLIETCSISCEVMSWAFSLGNYLSFCIAQNELH